MELFRFRVKEDPKRRERLIQIRKSIESSFRYEEDAMSRPLNASTLKRVYNIDSLWILEDGDVKKLGSANYSRELGVFNDLKDKYTRIHSIRIQRGGERYYVMELLGKTYAFSTPLELTNNEILMILREVEESLSQKRIFLNNNTNITEDDG